MTANERGEDGVVVSDPSSSTRWDTRRDPAPEAPTRRERGGLYIAIVAAIAFPFLIATAVVISNSTSPPRAEKRAPGNGITDVAVAGPQNITPTQPPPLVDDSPVTAEVAGASVTAPDAEVNDTDPEANLTELEPGSVDGPEGREVTTEFTISDEQPTDADPGVPATAPVAVDQPAVQAPAPAEPTPTTTTEPPATTTEPPAEPPATTTTTTTEVTEEPQAFAQRIDIGQLGENSLRFRFASEATTGYTAVVRQDGVIVSRTTGSAPAGTTVDASFNGLLPGTDYTVQVILDGPPSATSPAVPFRTAGGDAPEAEQPVSLQNLRLSSVGSTSFQVDYESNICANGSFSIREQGGAIVGSNAGQAQGCTTRHLGIPGFWTPALTPNTTYIITVSVEANGQGRGAGNTDSRSLTVTTAG